jgi:hypothetical protein
MVRRCVALLAALIAAGAGLLAAPQEKPKSSSPSEPRNLIPNGDFEKGTDSPEGWQQVDGLTTFWVNDPGGKRGKIIKIDTDVLQSQAYAWWVKIAKGAKAKDAPRKLPTVEPKYDTLAGNDGVWFWSDFIPAKKGQAYWLTIDVKGTPDVMAWLVGYEKKESTAFGADANAFQEHLKVKTSGKPLDRKRNFESFINKYSWRGQLNARYAKSLENGWKRWTRDKLPFRPTRMTPNVKFVRVLILPYWPPGVSYIDNVRLTEVEERE